MLRSYSYFPTSTCIPLHRHLLQRQGSISFQRTRPQGGSAAETFTKPGHPSFVNGIQTSLFISHKLRSEERRVGKECVP